MTNFNKRKVSVNVMAKKIIVSNIEIEVNKKNIKNMYLKVSRYDGKVSISAPLRTKNETITRFALSKIDWINKHKAKIESRKTYIELEYLPGEVHLVWGKPYTLEINYKNRNSISTIGDKLILTTGKDSTIKQREKLLTEWYRGQLKDKLPQLVKKWEDVIGVRVESARVKNMTSRWGTCNTKDKRIWINLQLAKKPIRCLEYVVVHELVHLLEASHNAVFKAYMDKYIPDWRLIKRDLNNF